MEVKMVWIICFFVVLFTGCQQKQQERQYTEIVTEVNQVKVTSIPALEPVSQKMIAWEAPDGWKEKAGTAMRMASFYQASDPEAIDCSIIALRGPAGGLEANLARWTGQIGLEASNDNIKHLTDSAQSLKTKDGLEVKVFDFTAYRSKVRPLIKACLLPRSL